MLFKARKGVFLRLLLIGQDRIEDLFLRLHVRHEFSLQVQKEFFPALRPGVSTFTAFLVAGSVPLLVFFGELVFRLGMSTYESFVYSIILTGFALLGLGAAKRMVTGRSALRSGLETLVVGGLAASVALGSGLS